MNSDDLKSTAPLAGAILAVIVAIIVSAVSFGNHRAPAPAKTEDAAAVARVSLIQLIATPERYDGKRVRAAGFLVNEGDDHALYLSVNDAANGLMENRIAVDFTNAAVGPDVQSALNREYVVLGGTFRANTGAPQIAAIETLEPATGRAPDAGGQ